MKMLLHRFPREDPSLKNQEALTPISDEFYKSVYTAPHSGILDRVIQILFFIFFLGWLRLIVMVTATVLAIILLFPLFIASWHESLVAIVLPVEERVAQIYIRVLAFTLGLYYIKINGEPDPDTRCFVYNHLCLLDGPLFYLPRKFSLVCTAGLKSLPYVNRLFMAVHTIFIDRSKSSGNTTLLQEGISNHSIYPLAVAPEGKISNGDMLFKFRTGAFVAVEQIQPVTFRYTHLLPVAGITLNSLVDSPLEWLWLCFCVPAAMVEITFLEPISVDKLKDKTPAERAEMAQLIMANHLGTLAGSRTSHEIFMEKTRSQ
jgi:1-acyl-sn-glycerol-3-phosphate acyltransferase